MLLNCKKIVPLFLILTVLLAACKGVSATQETPPPNTPTPPPAKTASAPTPTVAPTKATSTARTIAANCTVVSRVSQPDPTQASLFPPVTEKDWAMGPATAKVTFIEYSDFQ
jgi:hypothetical protein